MKQAKLAMLSLSLFLVCTVWLLYYNVSTFKSSNHHLPTMLQVMETELKDGGINFTSVLLATNSQSLEEMLSFHCSLPCLQKVIVVWNNLESSLVQQQRDNVFGNYCAAVNVTVIPQRDNSINNQFKPFYQIETDG